MSLDTLVVQSLGLLSNRSLDNDLMYGIEVEYENIRSVVRPPNLWSTTADGSLRNYGMEYVSEPLSRDTLDIALQNLERSLVRRKPDPHTRCGIHVHLNMRPRTIGEMYSFMVAYTLLEPSIFARFCPDRLLSAFCVPLYLNNNILMSAFISIQAARSGNRHALHNLVHTSKYSSLNAACLPQFGTLEVRQLPSTLDFTRIREWISMLTMLYDTATAYSDPLHVTGLYDSTSLQHFQDIFLGSGEYKILDTQQVLAVQAATIIAGYDYNGGY